jgi:hypothetical protein
MHPFSAQKTAMSRAVSMIVRMAAVPTIAQKIQPRRARSEGNSSGRGTGGPDARRDAAATNVWTASSPWRRQVPTPSTVRTFPSLVTTSTNLKPSLRATRTCAISLSGSRRVTTSPG